MAAPTSPYQTLGLITSAVIKDAKESTNTNMVALVKRWINEGYEKLANRQKRNWLNQRVAVQLSPAVQATCAVTNNSTTVTFTAGTTFTSGVELEFWSQGFEEIYNVSSTTLNVATLANPFLGTTNTSTQGTVFQPSIILDSSISEVYKVYHQYNQEPLSNIGPQEMTDLRERGGVQLDKALAYTIFGYSGTSKRLELFPYPDTAYTIYMDVNFFITELVNDSDEPLIPIKFRQILYFYGMYKLWLYHRNESQAANSRNEFDALTTALDNEFSPTVDHPQIIPVRQRATRRQRFVPGFDPRLRNS